MMLAGVFENEGILKLKEVEIPKLKYSDDIKIKVEVAGVCGTDVHILEVPQVHPGKKGIILGHEFVGEIVEIGSNVLELKVGDRVIAGPNIWCGQCEECRRGRRKSCLYNQALGISCDGGFAEYVVAPARAFYPVPKKLSPEQAVFAEPFSCLLNGFNRLGNCYGDNVIVLGSGPIGLYFVMLFKHFGASEVLVSEPNKFRRKFALNVGASKVVSPDELTKEKADIVVDTTGFLMKEAAEMTRSGGRTLLFGLDNNCNCNIRPFDIVREEKTILGCFIDNDMIPKCLDIIPNLSLDSLITHRYSLQDINKAIETVRAGSGIKTLIFPQGLQ